MQLHCKHIATYIYTVLDVTQVQGGSWKNENVGAEVGSLLKENELKENELRADFRACMRWQCLIRDHHEVRKA